LFDKFIITDTVESLYVITDSHSYKRKFDVSEEKGDIFLFDPGMCIFLYCFMDVAKYWYENNWYYLRGRRLIFYGS